MSYRLKCNIKEMTYVEMKTTALRSINHDFKIFAFPRTESRIRDGLTGHHVIGEHRRDALPSVRLLEPFLQLFEIPRPLLRRIWFTFGIPPRRVIVFVVCHFGPSLRVEENWPRRPIKIRGAAVSLIASSSGHNNKKRWRLSGSAAVTSSINLHRDRPINTNRVGHQNWINKR